MRFPLFNPDGSYYGSGTSSFFGYGLLKDGGFKRDRKEDFINNITATISNIAKGLEFKLIYGRETDNRENRTFNRTVNYYAGPTASSIKSLMILIVIVSVIQNIYWKISMISRL